MLQNDLIILSQVKQNPNSSLCYPGTSAMLCVITFTPAECSYACLENIMPRFHADNPGWHVLLGDVIGYQIRVKSLE